MTGPASADDLVSFRPLPDLPGVEIRDEVEDLTYTLRTDAPPTLEPADAEAFPFPVDEAVAFTGEKLWVQQIGMSLRDADGEHLGGFVEIEQLPRGTYYAEIGFSAKTYVRFEDAGVRAYSPVEDRRGGEAVFSLSRPTRIVVGTRSAHTCPSGVIETPPDPASLMEAFSHLGSAIKEFSPERSWPRLRGHPPAVELADDLRVPSQVTKPDTGITITAPETYESVYATAPLAYYLGATVEPGDVPALHTPSGLEYRLETAGESLEEAIDRVLVQCFFLDTLTRIGGYYDFDRREYERVAPHLPFYPPALYDEPVWKQVEQYLEVDFSDVAPHVPRWPVRATLRPIAEDATAIPWLLDDLALVHTADTPVDTGRALTVVTGRFETSDRSLCDRSILDPTEERSSPSAGDAPTGPSLVTDYDAYATPEVPATDGILVEAAYENQFDRQRWDVDGAPVTVVCNDPSLRDEVERVAERYRTREGAPPLDVDTVHDATTARLRGLLESDVGFLYYLGPTTESGFDCADGVLGVASIAACGATTFALTPTATPALGVELVERGSSAGIVARRGAATADAVDAVGRVADLLNVGVPFATAVHLAGIADAGAEYVLVGDGELELAEQETGVGVYFLDVDSRSPDAHVVTGTPLIGSEHRIGSVAALGTDTDYDNVQLSGNCVTKQEMTTDELLDFFGKNIVVRLNGGPVRRSEQLTVDDVVSSAE